MIFRDHDIAMARIRIPFFIGILGFLLNVEIRHLDQKTDRRAKEKKRDRSRRVGDTGKIPTQPDLRSFPTYTALLAQLCNITGVRCNLQVWPTISANIAGGLAAKVPRDKACLCEESLIIRRSAQAFQQSIRQALLKRSTCHASGWMSRPKTPLPQRRGMLESACRSWKCSRR